MPNETKPAPPIRELLKKPLVLILVAAGVLLLFFGGMESVTPAKKTTLAEETEAYRKALEGELAALCEKVSGAGKVTLLLTLDGSEEAVYAKDERNGATDYVVSAGEGLLLYRRHPAVLGVAVVCAGGDRADVRAELTALLSAALGVGANRIYITASQS